MPEEAYGLVYLKPWRGTISAGLRYKYHVGAIAGELTDCPLAGKAVPVLFGVPQSLTPEGNLSVELVTDGADPRRAAAVAAAARTLEGDVELIARRAVEKLSAVATTPARLSANIAAINLASSPTDAALDLSDAQLITRPVAGYWGSTDVKDVWRLTYKMVVLSRDLCTNFEGLDLLSMLATTPKPHGKFPSDRTDRCLHFNHTQAFTQCAALARILGLTLPFSMIEAFGGEISLLQNVPLVETGERGWHPFRITGLP